MWGADWKFVLSNFSTSTKIFPEFVFYIIQIQIEYNTSANTSSNSNTLCEGQIENLYCQTFLPPPSGWHHPTLTDSTPEKNISCFNIFSSNFYHLPFYDFNPKHWTFIFTFHQQQKSFKMNNVQDQKLAALQCQRLQYAEKGLAYLFFMIEIPNMTK